MKNLVFCSIAALLFITVPGHLQAQAPTEKARMEVRAENNEIKLLTERLETIRKMDRSKMTAPQRKELRKEVRAIKEKLETNSGGIYISVGAAILIAIILLILL